MASCSDGGGTNVEGTVATVTGAMTPDLSNERVEGSFTLAIAATDEGSGVTLERFDLALSTVGGALTNVTVEADRTFPILMKPGTQARVQYRFAANGALPPPPQLTGWCLGPAFIQLQGALVESAESGGSLHTVAIPMLAAARAATPEAADVGAVWAARLEGGANMVVDGLAVDAAGNTLVSLQDARDGSGGLVDADGNPIGGPVGSESFSPRLTRLDAAGDLLWTRDLDEVGDLTSVLVAAGADVEILAGTFDGLVDLVNGAILSYGPRDVYVARLNPEGNALWRRQVGGSTELGVHGVEVDASGNAVIAGSSLSGQVQIGEQVIDPDPAAPPDARFGFLFALDPLGEHRFAQRLAAVPTALAVDASGAILLAGSFVGTVDLGGGLVTSGEEGDLWVVKLDSAGQHVWSRHFAGGGRVTALEAGPGGEVHFTAQIARAIDFGGGPLEGEGEPGLVVVKLDPEGGHLWSQRYAESFFDQGTALAVDDAGRVFLSGALTVPARFGAVELPNGGEIALFAAQLEPSGEPIRAGFFGCSGGFRPALAFRSGVSESVLLAATFQRFAALGGEAITSSANTVVLAGLGPEPP